MALSKLLSHSRPVLPQRDCGSRMSVQGLGRMLKFYAIIRAGAVCAVGQIYSNLNICEDVLPFLLYMFSVPHIVTGPCGSPQNVPCCLAMLLPPASASRGLSDTPPLSILSQLKDLVLGDTISVTLLHHGQAITSSWHPAWG